MRHHEDLMAQPSPTLLPGNPDAEAMLQAGTSAREVAAMHPEYSGVWAALAEKSLANHDPVAAYAYARTGYHRGLDALRGHGWKGWGPVPWSHEGNRGVLRCFYLLAQAAAAIGETDEHDRLLTLINDSDPTAMPLLEQLR